VLIIILTLDKILEMMNELGIFWNN